MSFQLKNFKSIVASMINYSKATQDTLTDFHVGSVVRTLFEAPAIEVDQFYQQVFYGLLDAIPVALYRAFGFEQLSSAGASGYVRFYGTTGRTANVTIPADSILTKEDDGDSKYIVVQDTILTPTDSYVDVRVVAQTTGTDGNADIGEVTQCNVSITGIDSLSNVTAITGGRDEETEEEEKKRFIEYIEAISKSTVKAVTYGVKQATVTDSNGVVYEYVTDVGLVETTGVVNVYIYGSGGIASDELVTNAQTLIDGTYDAEKGVYVEGYRPTGVGVFVSAMTETSVDFTISVKMDDTTLQTDAKKAEIKTIISQALASTNVGEKLSMMDVKTAVLGIDGVVQVSVDNSQNITRNADEVLVIGTLTVTWL